jgi:uncharacterized protein (TIGR00251 family)
MEIPCRRTREGLSFRVRVQPRSSRKCVDGVEGGVLKVRLTAPPAEGEANAQLLEVLSKEFGVRKTAFTIIRGRGSREKTVEVEGPPEGFPAGPIED